MHRFRDRQGGACAGHRQRLIDQGAEPVGSSPEAFAKLMREKVARWAEVVKV